MTMNHFIYLSRLRRVIHRLLPEPLRKNLPVSMQKRQIYMDASRLPWTIAVYGLLGLSIIAKSHLLLSLFLRS